MKKDSAFWAACRIHRVLSHVQVQSKAMSVPSLSTLAAEQQVLEQCWRMLNKARDWGWMLCADILQRRLIAQIAAVHSASRNIYPARVSEVPAVTDILSEIRHLEDEFDLVMVFPKEKYISVTTDAITLEDVDLGAFTIQLDLDRLARRRDVSAFTIVAENANPATSDSACTHPHVRDESLCAGDASVPIAHALAEGRIGDAFQLINRVLHTYNNGSAYVTLNDWDGRDCGDCGNTTPGDYMYGCELCGSDFCEDCIRTCDGCELSICCNCSETNEDGNRLCLKCKILDDEEREETDEEEETPISDDPIHDPTEVVPQPTTEKIYEHSHSNPTETRPPAVELPGGPRNDGGGAVTVDVSAAQAA